MPAVADNIARVQERIARACARAGRNPHSVHLMAVTKMVAPETIREAAAAGVQIFGENRVQERAQKHDALAGVAAEWHLIGHLQGNKAARAVHLFHTIQTIDSPSLASKLEAACAGHNRPVLPVFIEINVGREPQKSGVLAEQATELAQHIRGLSHLLLCGVMTVPPYDERPENSRRYFSELREMSERLRPADASATPQAWQLSMGMSHDFEIAIEEGATLVRIGAAIFGPRS